MNAQGLAGRLRNGSLTGVHRIADVDDIVAAAKAAGLEVVRVSLAGVRGKRELLDRIAVALGFPDWFGANWDALEDCLTDLSWREAAGRVLLFEDAVSLREGAPQDWDVLRDILSASAEYWVGQETPFVVAFVDPMRALGLPDLPHGGAG